MEYGPQIRNLVNKIENFKWQGDIGLGYHFVQTDPPYDGESTKDRIFLTANTFHYGDYVGETLMYLVQSKYNGYIDVVDFKTSDRFTVRYNEADNTIGFFKYGRPDTVYKSVEEWPKNPNPVEERGDRGFIF